MVLGIYRCNQHASMTELGEGSTNGTILGWWPSLSRIFCSIEMASAFFASKARRFSLPDQIFMGDFITTPSPASKKSAVLPGYERRCIRIRVLDVRRCWGVGDMSSRFRCDRLRESCWHIIT